MLDRGTFVTDNEGITLTVGNTSLILTEYELAMLDALLHPSESSSESEP